MKKNKQVPKSKIQKLLHNRTALEWILFVLLLLLAIAFLVSRSDWWMWPDDSKLGTAFSTSRKIATENADSIAPLGAAGTNGTAGGGTGTATRTNGGSTTTTTNNSSTTTNNGGGSNNGGGGGGGGGGDDSSNAPILSLAAGINTGDSLADINARVAVNGLSQNCVVAAELPLVGTQKVCIYTKNGLTITVTYLNDRVLSAALSGM